MFSIFRAIIAQVLDLSQERENPLPGVELEAMTAASVAALTVYYMCKGMDRGITIREAALLHKEGGKSGTYRRKGKP